MNPNRHILQDGTQLHGKDYVYEIVKLLGQGSFGITYLAKVCLKGSLGVIQGNIYVAIKEFYMADVNSRVGTQVDSGTESGLFHAYHSRFQKEALNISSMNHPGIVKVMEVFSENNTSYMVMEYLSGGTLDNHIEKRKTSPENEAKRIIALIAQALSYMHDRQMLHLDLKPGNIMLRENGQPVLIDFGLSKHYNENGIPETSTPIGLGTPGYAPIEQSEYQESDGFQPTMDIYALGATLFKMLTGKVPPSAATVLNRPSMLNDFMIAAGVTQATRDLVLSCMQPLRKARPQSVQDFLSRMAENPYIIECEDESTLVGDADVKSQLVSSNDNDCQTPSFPQKEKVGVDVSYVMHTDVKQIQVNRAVLELESPVDGSEINISPATSIQETNNEIWFKNDIAAVGNKFIDKENHEISVINPIITQFIIITFLLTIIMTAVLLVIYSNSYTLHEALPTFGLWISKIKNGFLNSIGHIGFIYLIVFIFLSALCSISYIYFRFKVLAYSRAYRAQEVVRKSILDSYDDYAYLMTCGLLAVKKEEKWGFIDKKGQTVIPIQYDWVSVFKRGRAKVVLDKEEMMINTKGERIDN